MLWCQCALCSLSCDACMFFSVPLDQCALCRVSCQACMFFVFAHVHVFDSVYVSLCVQMHVYAMYASACTALLSREMNTQKGNTQMHCTCMCMHFTHTHTLNAHMIYTCMYVWIVYSPCLPDVIDLIGLLCLIWMHMHKHTTHSARTCHKHMHTHTHTCSIRD